MSKVLITGASGLIGRRLTDMLIEKGHDVSHLGRSRRGGDIKTWVWDIEKRQIEKGALRDADVIIHLAGAGIAEKRWTEKRKQEILESRTFSTQLLADELRKGNHHVKKVICASAIGYYGFADEDKMLHETDPPGADFLASVVKKWEDELHRFEQPGLGTAIIRIGIVLSMEGGVLKEIAKPVRLYVGSPLGSGKQQVSWIHIDDVCRVFIKAVEDPRMSGVFNAVGPYPVSNAELTKAIAKVLKRPILLPRIPTFALKLFFGEMADLVLNGSRVSPEKLVKGGFRFRFATLEEALDDLLKPR